MIARRPTVRGRDAAGRLLSILVCAAALAATPSARAGICTGDLNFDGVVDVSDLVSVILGWGCTDPPPPACMADVTMDGAVDVNDLVAVILAWGPCPPPANDPCSGAITIGLGDTFYDSEDASTDGIAHVGCTADGQIHEDLWYRYVSACDGVLQVSTCDQAVYDSALALYLDTGACPPGAAQLLDCNDDFCTAGSSYVEAVVSSGQTYLIRVGGGEAGKFGLGTLSLACGSATDDNCFFATPIAPGRIVTVDTAGAAADPGALRCGATPGPFEFPGRWLKTTGTGGQFRVTLCNDASNFFFNTRLSVYEGPCNDPTCVVLNEPVDNNFVCGPNECISWCTSPGVEYHILISADEDGTGIVDVMLESAPGCGGLACDG